MSRRALLMFILLGWPH